MSRKIQVLRGQMKDLPTLDVGELAWVMDEQRLYIGNGETNVVVGNIGTSNITPAETNTSTIGTSTLRYETAYLNTAASTTSDENSKDNITDLAVGLDFLDKIQPKQYNLKDDETVHFGLIAQEVEKAFKELDLTDIPVVDVSEGSNGKKTYGLRYEELTPVLINAIKELKQTTDYLKSEVGSLKTKLNQKK